jgi:hypothetical protein
LISNGNLTINFDHFSRAIGYISVSASHKASDVCLDIITESKLDVVHGLPSFLRFYPLAVPS